MKLLLVISLLLNLVPFYQSNGKNLKELEGESEKNEHMEGR
jgi:hypothetical protein